MKDEKFFGEDIEKIRGKYWDWKNFNLVKSTNCGSTKNFPISKYLLDWVVGQDKVMDEVQLSLDEWLYKLKYLQEMKWYEPWIKPIKKLKYLLTIMYKGKKRTIIKLPSKNQLSWKSNIKKHSSLTNILTPGPYLLLLGDPGTGKSLIGRAMSEKLTQMYKKHRIKVYDVISWKNKVLSSEPKISIMPTSEGKKLVTIEKKKESRKGFLKRFLLKAGTTILASLGSFLLFIGFYNIFVPWITNGPVTLGMYTFPHAREVFENNFFEYIMKIIPNQMYFFMIGGSLLMSAVFIMFFGRMFGGNLTGKGGIGGAESTDAPKLLIDNSDKIAKFIDATGHGSAQLFGSVAWDPYQTGGLGTPSHQRVTAGDVHRANLGILYIDEIKNLNPAEAITLLTVLEDGQLPITMRSQWHGGDTSAMAVSTEPIPCTTFLIAAGNFDSINQIHPALMDRLVGYGKVVRMANDMPNTLKNRRKYVQFIAQEGKRFHLPPFSKEACIEIVREGRRRSSKRYRLATKFRPLISIIKTAGTLAMNNKSKVVKAKHILESINEHCKSIQKQLLEHQIQEKGMFMEIEPEGNKLGVIYGLAVVTESYSGEHTGTVLRVKASMDKVKKKHNGSFVVTGIAKESKWIEDSTKKVKSVILKKYGVDISQDYNTYIDFSQAYGVDGPSAGVTMAILLCSLLEGKHIKQDIAVTGEINISSSDEIEVTSVGGIHEKIKAAESWGFKKVIIPTKNFNLSINPSEYKIKIIGAKNLSDYLKNILI